MVRHLVVFSLFLTLFSTQSQAREKCNFACKEIPDPSEVLSTIGSFSQKELPQNLNIYVWNIYKSRKDAWQSMYNQIVQTADLVLFQETMINPGYLNNYEASNLGWSHATSFFYDDEYLSPTGVATASRVTPIRTEYFRTKVKEPFVASYKVTVVTEYRIAGSKQTLMVANIHGINRHTEVELKAQVNAVLASFAKHTGPVIFAGDFNTRNSARTKAVDAAMAAYGLTRVVWGTGGNQPGQLDHAYVRGLKVNKSIFNDKIEGSDHPLLYLETTVEAVQ